MNAYVEIPAGTTCTMTDTGRTFTWGEDDLVKVDGVTGIETLILGGTVSVLTASVRKAG